MKPVKRIAIVLLSFVIALTMTPVAVYAKKSKLPDYYIVIHYDSNKGSGTMEDQTVKYGIKTPILENEFTRENYVFTGWNAVPDGSGQTYQPGDEASIMVSPGLKGLVVNFYAQWKLDKEVEAPTIKKLSKKSVTTLQVQYEPVQGVDGYEIQISTSKKFKKAKKVFVEPDVTKLELLGTVPGKKNYVRVRSYIDTGTSSGRVYSEWSKVLNKSLPYVSTITNTSCHQAIEADVVLKGSGSGYHAKFVMGNAVSAVSFGIQYDVAAIPPYAGRAMALIENVGSNDAGNQTYVRPNDVELPCGQKHHLMMTLNKNGSGDVYVNYKKIGSFYNPNLKGDSYLHLEGSSRLNGDSINITFSNIRIKRPGQDYDPSVVYTPRTSCRGKGFKSKYNAKKNTVTMTGKLKLSGGDWDSRYDEVSADAIY